MKNKRDQFLKYFIEKEKYLQNPPLKTKEFIKEAKKRRIETDVGELEFFEREKLLFPIIRIDRPVLEEQTIEFAGADGQVYCRPVRYGLKDGEQEIQRYTTKFYAYYDFSDHSKPLLLNWLTTGNLYDPHDKPFVSWANSQGDRLKNGSEKIISYYSIFQLHWLRILKKSFQLNINFAGDSIKVIAPFLRVDGTSYSARFQINELEDLNEKLRELSNYKHFDINFDPEKKKKELRKNLLDFQKILKSLLNIQTVYYPLSRSSSKSFQLSGDDKKWYEIRRRFDANAEIKNLNLRDNEIAIWYKIFSEQARKLLTGGSGVGWLQLWKSIKWDKKDRLEGAARLGVDYLQWSLMLKFFLERLTSKEILDIDEIHNIQSGDILKFDASNIHNKFISLRAFRNERYYDEKNNKNYFHDTYKRLFYLANDFDLNYQPRVMVFVEGKTEALVIPELLEILGEKDLGIIFFNYEGINKFFGRKRDGVVSNFNHLISYNLEQWQIIPYLLGDREGNIQNLIKKGKVFKYYSIPRKWHHLWKQDFEFDNFTDNEIASALSEVLRNKISVKCVKYTRLNGKAIKFIETGCKGEIENNKVAIGKRLVENLKNEYDRSHDDALFERPVFKVVNEIVNMAVLNHMPVDTEIENLNKDQIKKWLEEDSTKS